MVFYLLSLLTGVLECGWIAFGVIHSLPLYQILCYPLAYHIGNLFPKPFSLNRTSLYIMSVLSIIINIVILISKFSFNIIFVLTCISLFLVSAVIQSIRSNLKSDGNRLLKRIFRVGGFALAPITIYIPSTILIFSSVIAILSISRYPGKSNISRATLQNGFSLVMIFHQLHYFFYAHITLTSISFVLNSSFKHGVLIGALLFCCTWITYMSVEPIVSKITSKIVTVFYIGHIGISILLFIMSMVTNHIIFCILWIITGFGGGVVYTITAQAKLKDCYDKTSMVISENIGHTLGLLTAVIVSMLFEMYSSKIMLIFGSISALLTVISMFITLRKDYHYENI